MNGTVVTYEELQKRKRDKVAEDARNEEESRTPEGDMKIVLGEDSVSE